MSANDPAVRRLRAVVEADPTAVIRVLHQFQLRNLIARRVSAQLLGNEYIEIDIEVDSSAGTSEAFDALVAKINQMVSVVTAVACT
jgi:hypothetical protein